MIAKQIPITGIVNVKKTISILNRRRTVHIVDAIVKINQTQEKLKYKQQGYHPIQISATDVVTALYLGAVSSQTVYLTSIQFK